MVVGIDLGTTNSLAAFINHEGKPEIIINERGSRLTPSVVFFKNEQEVLVGELARSQLILKADRTVNCIKRKMGSGDEVLIGERGYNPAEISALILRKVVQYAQEYLGREIEAAVVTVPAYFNDNQRQATLMAGELAGLKILKLLNEPTAAALAYGAELDRKEHILVLDIGGGTFDITLMENEENICRVVCTGGSTTLGGIDFDNRLAAYILKTFKATTGIDMESDPVALQQIQINAEKAKIDLSSVNDCSVLIPYITMGDTGPIHLNQVIRREEFTHLCSDLFNQIRDLIKQTFAKAQVDEQWVDIIVLAGGACRMPGFKNVVQGMFNGIEIKQK
jgi:molecular chaperone DnaK